MKKQLISIKVNGNIYKLGWAKQTKKDGSIIVGFYPKKLDNYMIWATEC